MGDLRTNSLSEEEFVMSSKVEALEEMIPQKDSNDMTSAQKMMFLLASPGRFINRKFSPGSLKGSVFTTIASTVGAGILSLPYGIKIGGLYFGIVIFFICMFVSLYTCILLCICAEKTGQMTYEGIGAYAYGNWMGKFAEINMIINNYFTIIAYIVLVASTQIQSLFPAAFSLMGVSSDSFLCSKYFWGPLITCLITFPLSLAKMISMLRYSSLLSFVAIMYVTLVILGEFFVKREGKTTSDFTGADAMEFTFFGIFETVPLVIFAYTCHPNVVPIYSVGVTQELQRRSVRRGAKFLFRGLFIVLLMYLVVGIFGYLTFYKRYSISSFPQLILIAHYGHGNGAVIFVSSTQAIFAMAVTALCGTPLLVYPCRDATYSTLGWNKQTLTKFRHVTVVSSKVHAVIVFSALGIALVAPGMGIVIGIIGSISSPIICFSLPCFYYVKLYPGKWYRRDLLLCWAVNIIVTIFSLIAFIILILSLANINV